MDSITGSNNDWNIIRINEFMKASELKIGNLVNRLGRMTQVLAMQQSEQVDYVSTPLSGAVTINQIEPIPLTEEWLLKFGFTLVEESPFEEIKMKYWVRNRICLFFNESEPFNTYLLGFADQRFGKYSVVTGNWIEYVHTIQNAFHSLTGEELTIKE